MKKIILLALMLTLFSCEEKNRNEYTVEKRFHDNDTYEIICKGLPKDSLTGKARIESAKEAALINAQFIAKDIFEEPVDVVKNGTIKKYDINADSVIIYYVITYKDLKKYFKE
ncbi:MAG: hypothetical protein JW864_06955 [Spirochaetes bacterium]|nr:hypothetical protein [Spirochaetota bacterium]